MALAVASRYARALADLVLDPAKGIPPQTAAAELAAFEQMVAVSPDLRTILLSPAVTPARKRALVSRLAAEMGSSRLVRNFLYVIIGHRRTAMLSEIRQAFQSILDERTGSVEADVKAARELTPAERENIGVRLGRVTGKTVRCEFSVDEGLIGGAVTRIGSTIYDGSVRGQLDALRRKLTD
jgi:F-type H+-transporting ATPase subunit delta